MKYICVASMLAALMFSFFSAHYAEAGRAAWAVMHGLWAIAMVCVAGLAGIGRAE